jgi:CDP-diacylglycerol--glycerol-3-phosphate 3-phosphatidyltransferase
MNGLKRQLPNILTFIRVCITPLFLVTLFHKSAWSGIVSIALFLLLALTDLLDGYLARRWDISTPFGAFMDPLADKLLVGGTFVCFLLIPGFLIPVWLVGIILFRELAVTVLRSFAVRRGRPIRTEFAGKLKTVFQMFTIAVLLVLLLLLKLRSASAAGAADPKALWTGLYGTIPGRVLFFLPPVLVSVSAVLALSSMVIYLVKNLGTVFDWNTRRISEFFLKLLATGFYAGYMPQAPGSFASLIGAGLWVLMSRSPVYPLFTAGFSACAVFIAHRAETRVFHSKDHSAIVIDEIAGMLLTFFSFSFSAGARGILYLILGFALFRFFDIVKPPPIRKVERLQGGFGVVCDDLVSAVYANILLQLLRVLLSA